MVANVKSFIISRGLLANDSPGHTVNRVNVLGPEKVPRTPTLGLTVRWRCVLGAPAGLSEADEDVLQVAAPARTRSVQPPARHSPWRT